MFWHADETMACHRFIRVLFLLRGNGWLDDDVDHPAGDHHHLLD